MADLCYLVATDDSSPELATVRAAGLDLAVTDDASVVLFDRTSASLLTDPYPAGPWSNEDDAVSAATRLTPQMLNNLGRHYLAEQLTEARERGLEAHAHMAQGAGAEAIADAIGRYGCSVVILPQSFANPSLADRVRGNTLDRLRKATNASIHLVDDSGEMHEA